MFCVIDILDHDHDNFTKKKCLHSRSRSRTLVAIIEKKFHRSVMPTSCRKVKQTYVSSKEYEYFTTKVSSSPLLETTDEQVIKRKCNTIVSSNQSVEKRLKTHDFMINQQNDNEYPINIESEDEQDI